MVVFMAEFDMELDEVGIRISPALYCGKCNTKMLMIDSTNFRCPRCGYEYKEK